MLETIALRESLDIGEKASDRLDIEKGILRGVKVLGVKSKNKREYTPQCIKGALPLIEGARVYIDHPTKEEEEAGGRSVLSRFGRLREAKVDAAGEAFADLHFNPHHKDAKAFIWYIQNDPKDIGLSINGDGRGRRLDNGHRIVEQITKLASVDLVDGPATVGGLFEQERPDMADVGTDPAAPETPGADEGPSWRQKLGDLAQHVVSDEEMKPADVLKKLRGIVALLESEEEGEEGAAEKKDEPTEEEAKEQLKVFRHPAVKVAARVLDGKLRDQKRGKLREQAVAAKVPAKAITDTFLDQLCDTADVKLVEKLIEDRKAVALPAGPIARSSTRDATPPPPKTTKTEQSVEELAAAIFSD